MGLTLSQVQNISSPNGNSLAVFIDGVTGIISLKDVNGHFAPLSNYVCGGGGGGNSPFEFNANATGIQPIKGNNSSNGNYSFIGGGYFNKTYASNSTIGGGKCNKIFDICGTIGGGERNTICNPINCGAFANRANVISGGKFNSILQSTDGNGAQGANTIGGGYRNYITPYHSGNTIGGGQYNRTYRDNSTVSGGFKNCAICTYSTVGGGSYNKSCSERSIIGGGFRNITSIGASSAILGGSCNIVSYGCSVIVGGYCNLVVCGYSAIGGGKSNIITSFASVIGGGFNNRTSGNRSFIGGGDNNHIDVTGDSDGVSIISGLNNSICGYGLNVTIVGGNSNSIIGNVNCHSFIGGGCKNVIYGDYNGEKNVIVGGQYNCICFGSDNFIGGGNNNHINATKSSIVGGFENSILSGTNNFIGGGYLNRMSDTRNFIGTGEYNCNYGTDSSIVSGAHNFNCGVKSFIGAGHFNCIFTNTLDSSIISGYCNSMRGCRSFIGAGQTNRVYSGANDSSVISGCNNRLISCLSFIGSGYNNIITNNSINSSIISGSNNNTNYFTNVHIIGSNITATQACTTFMNCASVGNLTLGCVVAVGNNCTLINATPKIGSFFSNVTQCATTINTPKAMTLSNTDAFSSGISIVSTSRITVDATGIYNLQFSAQVDRVTTSGTDTMSIWLRKNGVDVANTNTIVTVSGSANQAKVVASWNFYVSLTAGQYVELVFSVTDLQVRLVAFPLNATVPYPLTPSLIVTIQKIN